jgi:acetylornithine deacetylase
VTSLTNRDLLARLVAFDTASHRSNILLADFIADYLDLPGVDVQRQFSPDKTRANLVIRLGADGPGPQGLVVSGHMDTVPADEPDWASDPHTLT